MHYRLKDSKCEREYGERGRHVPDDEWASHVASRNWLALSSDKKLLSGIGKEVLTEARLGVFYLWRNDVPGDVKVNAVLSNLAPMISLWRSEDRPFVYRFDASRITRVWP